MVKRDPGKVYLARKLGAQENAAVKWNPDGKHIELEWVSPTGFSYHGFIGPKLAKLLAARIGQCLKG